MFDVNEYREKYKKDKTMEQLKGQARVQVSLHPKEVTEIIVEKEIRVRETIDWADGVVAQYADQFNYFGILLDVQDEIKEFIKKPRKKKPTRKNLQKINAMIDKSIKAFDTDHNLWGADE